MIATLCLCAALTGSAAPPKAGPPRLLAVSSNASGNWEIYLIDPDTKAVKNISNHKAADTEPVWSPDGKKIAFVSDRGGAPEIWVMKEDGGEPKRLTEKSGGAAWLRWSPDGKRIAFVGAKGGTDNVYTADAETGKITQLTDEKFRCDEPEWSPDGKKIAFSAHPPEGRWQVRLMNSDGTGKRDLTDSEGGSRAAWSPDGKRLAFMSLRDEGGFRLYAIGADGRNVRDLFSHPAPCLTSPPQWSPDGKSIAFAEWNGEEKKMQITVVDADGKTPRVLTKADAHAHPRWSPDGKSLSYGRFEDEHGYFRDRQSAVLIVSDADGKNPRELIRGYRTAEWKPK